MIAAAAGSGATWSLLVAAAVFLLALGALVVDRARLKQRVARAERAEAMLRTDLADARRETTSLRDVLHGTTGEPAARGRATRPGPGDPGAPVA